MLNVEEIYGQLQNSTINELRAMNGRSFISYSALDAGLASAVYAFLKSNGHDAVKAPDDIALGEDWAASIASLIEQSDYFILLWTHNSMSSKEVAKELTLAMDCGSKIIPFRAEDLSPEGAWRYHLMNVQWLEAHAMPEASALEALLAYFRRTQKGSNNYESSSINVTSPKQGANDDNPHEEVREEISKQAKSLTLDYAEAGLGIIDTGIKSEEIQPIEASANNLNGNPSSSPSLETLNQSEVQNSANNHSVNGSWQFSAAVEIACTLGYLVGAASEVHSKRTFLGYRLCDKDGMTLALIPLAMIDAKSPSTNKSRENEFEMQKPEGEIDADSFFYAILDIAKKMGYNNLDSACEAKSHKGIVNFVIRDTAGKAIARIPLSMISNRVQ